MNISWVMWYFAAVATTMLCTIFWLYVRKDFAKDTATRKGLNATTTFYSLQYITKISLISFESSGLRMIEQSSLFLPKWSLLRRDDIIPYEEIISIALGEGTAAVKTKKLHLKTILDRYNYGPIATMDEPRMRLLTSRSAREKFRSLAHQHNVPVEDVALKGRRTFIIVLATALLTTGVFAALYFYTLSKI